MPKVQNLTSHLWRSLQIASALLLLSLGSVPAQTPDATFHDGDTWSVVGDSITQNGTYYEWVYLYYLTRFPTMKLEVWNCGISGDTAAGTVRRYPWDVQPRHATVATIMLGMNDVGRDLYNDPNPNPHTLEQQANALATYRQNMEALVKLLQADKARLIFLTPTPFDETVELDKPRQTGVNEALGQCAEFEKKLAADSGGAVIDFHEPMTKLNTAKQATDPKFTIIGPDRIHPGPPGHFVMSYFFLKGQNAPSVVSDVEIDVPSKQATKSDNATVSDLSAAESAVSFKSLENALPYPILPELQPALAWVPFQDELNRETLRVTGLKAGSYTLFIDDQKIADLDAAQLATGINLATYDSTPQAHQAAQVGVLVKKWQSLMANGVRGISQVEHFFLKDVPHPVDFETVKPRIEALIPPLDPKKDGYNIAILKRYLDFKPKQQQTEKTLADLVTQMRAAAQPQVHAYRLAPATPAAP